MKTLKKTIHGVSLKSLICNFLLIKYFILSVSLLIHSIFTRRFLQQSQDGIITYVYTTTTIDGHKSLTKSVSGPKRVYLNFTG